jgi:predicted transcriptional regulator
MKYRSRIDIIANMLEAAQDGAIKTKIMAEGFLSYPQLKEYLELLIDGGLLEYTNEEKKYRTTVKGRYFLRMYDEVGSTIAPKDRHTMTHYY